MRWFQNEHLDLFLMKSYPDFSLNAQIEHRNFDISFLGFKNFKRIKIEPIRVLYDLPRNHRTGKPREGCCWDGFKQFSIAKNRFSNFDRKVAFSSLFRCSPQWDFIRSVQYGPKSK